MLMTLVRPVAEFAGDAVYAFTGFQRNLRRIAQRPRDRRHRKAGDRGDRPQGRLAAPVDDIEIFAALRPGRLGHSGLSMLASGHNNTMNPACNKRMKTF
jgi:hypothetical protein